MADRKELLLLLESVLTDSVDVRMHINDINQAVMDKGWVYGGKTDPKIIVFETIRKATRAENPAFIFLGSGVFALKSRVGVNELLTAIVAPRKKDKALLKSTAKASVRQTCGNCAAISYVGIKEITLESGLCNSYELSGRLNNRNEAAGCDHWRPRSAAQMRADQTRSAQLSVHVEAFNTGKKRGGKKRTKSDAIDTGEDD